MSMATERFHRLSDEKKAAIRKAAIEEFACTSYDKVSINKIIQKAGISRGSFYTYFEDKKDVLQYIFEHTRSRVLEFCKKTLNKNKGNFWDTMEELVEYSIEYCEANDLIQFSRNLLYCQELMPQEDKALREEIEEWIVEHMDKSQYRIYKREEFKALFMVSSLNVMAAIGQYFHDKLQIEQVRKNFRMQMNLIRYGVESLN